MNKLSKLGLTAGVTMLFSSVTFAHNHAEIDWDTTEFSTETYCLLKSENVEPRYLKAYAKRLEKKPSRKTCKAFNEFAASVTPDDWDYPQNRPYPGSIIKLSPQQIEKLRMAKKERSN
ncbi:hypothetical protein OPS25_15515 [Alteromonas ponticola]|uniref:YARHG domain-containing protein n=1 Tax=Alteromonas aquimaris TaxID=2998417 RepID=A0ABT3PAW8_9ALTE|nr:hypothetical protein [Alteromonas aquimaris]MCW8109915.1 hypothetical protein [Alteromonas aquimaris]